MISCYAQHDSKPSLSFPSPVSCGPHWTSHVVFSFILYLFFFSALCALPRKLCFPNSSPFTFVPTKDWMIFYQVCNTIAWRFDRSSSYSILRKQRQITLSTVKFNCNQGHKNLLCALCANLQLQGDSLWYLICLVIMSGSKKDFVSWTLSNDWLLFAALIRLQTNETEKMMAQYFFSVMQAYSCL